MRVLVACEYSARVRDAFRARGHDAYSCDLEPCEGDSFWHLQFPVETLLDKQWDLMIAHPPCTYLANSGVRWLHSDSARYEKMIGAVKFFKLLMNAPISKIAIENPVMHGHARELIGVHASQTIQPWQFGHTEVKRTCLWLRGLPHLKETNNVRDQMMQLSYAERARVHHAAPGPNRWKDRSRTYLGIAAAMAEQWG